MSEDKPTWTFKTMIFNPETGEEIPLDASPLERLAAQAESDEVRQARIERYKKEKGSSVTLPIDNLPGDLNIIEFRIVDNGGFFTEAINGEEETGV